MRMTFKQKLDKIIAEEWKKEGQTMPLVDFKVLILVFAMNEAKRERDKIDDVVQQVIGRSRG